MKSFDSPGDVGRAFEFLRKKSWKTASPMDRAIFISMLQDIPAAYGITRVLIAGNIIADILDWFWFNNALDLGKVSPGDAESRSRYHNGGIKLPERDKFNGWFFVPHYISLEFFTTLNVRKSAAVTYVVTLLRSDNQDLLGAPGRTIGISNGVDKERSHFLVDHQTETLNDDRIGTLFRTILLPHSNSSVGPLSFSGFSNLVEGDKMRITMEGRWFFSPRFIEEQISSDD